MMKVGHVTNLISICNVLEHTQKGENMSKMIKNVTISAISIFMMVCMIVTMLPAAFVHAAAEDSAEREFSIASEAEKIQIENYLSTDYNPADDNTAAGMLKAPTVPSPGAKTSTKISYAKIKSAAGTAASLATLASIIVAILSNNYEIPGMVSTVLSKIEKIGSFTSLVAKGDSNHGIKVNLAYTTKMVKGKKRAVWKVTSITTY